MIMDTIKRDFYLSGELTVQTSTEFMKLTTEMKRERIKDLVIFINSPGGKLRALKTIIDAIKDSEINVTTINIGIAASTAAILFMEGDKRICIEGSELIFHEPRVSLSKGNLTYTEISDLKRSLDGYYHMFLNYMTKKTNMEYKEAQSKIRNVDYTLSAVQALKLGFATEVVTNLIKYIS